MTRDIPEGKCTDLVGQKLLPNPIFSRNVAGARALCFGSIAETSSHIPDHENIIMSIIIVIVLVPCFYTIS